MRRTLYERRDARPGNAGTIVNVINTTGGQTPTNSTPSTVLNYP
jgi:hypothetical protein